MRFIFTLLLCLWFGPASAQWSEGRGWLTGAGWLPLAKPSGAIPLSIDGSGTSNNTSGATTPVTISTANSNDIIIIIAAPNAGPITSVSGATVGAFTFRSRSNASGGTV